MSFSQNDAETVALQALAWLVGNEDLVPVFLGASGADAADLRNAAHDPVFLGGLLDFILMDDAWVIGCCDAQDIAYDRMQQARAALPGGDQVSWT